MRFILTKPLSGSSSQSSNTGIVTASTTDVVDTVSLTINTIKWLVELIDNTNNKIRSYEIMAINKFNIATSYTIYGIIGDKISHDINVSINGSNIDLNITNNEFVDLNYKILRLEIT